MTRWMFIFTLLVPLVGFANGVEDADINAIFTKIYALYKGDKTGANADYIPALAK